MDIQQDFLIDTGIIVEGFERNTEETIELQHDSVEYNSGHVAESVTRTQRQSFVVTGFEIPLRGGGVISGSINPVELYHQYDDHPDTLHTFFDVVEAAIMAKAGTFNRELIG